MARVFEPREVADQLRLLGLRRGDVLLAHTGYRAVRPVDGGPDGFIDALIQAVGPEGTLAMPSWTGDDAAIFDPCATPAASDLGVTAELFRRRPGVSRSAHPFAFAAHGPQATRIVEGRLTLPPHAPDSPVSRVHDLDGRILLVGAGHDANTTIHLAEVMAAVPYGVPHACTIERDGRPVRLEYLENDHCCALFEQMDGWLRERGLQAEGPVGHAYARLMSARDVTRVAMEKLKADSLVFLHGPEAGCDDCDAARASVRA